MAFNSCSLAPDPTPIEKTVTPAPLSLAASAVVSDKLLDWPEIMNHFQKDLAAIQTYRRKIKSTKPFKLSRFLFTIIEGQQHSLILHLIPVTTIKI